VATILKIFLTYRLTIITVRAKLTRLLFFHLKSVMLELDPSLPKILLHIR